jgi:hypothetical protein
MQVQIAVKGLQFVQNLDEVLETATKPVNGSRRDHVDMPRCGRSYRGGGSRQSHFKAYSRLPL